VAEITFNVTYQPQEPEPSANCTLALTYTELLDYIATPVPHEKENGYYTVLPLPTMPVPSIKIAPMYMPILDVGERFTVNVTVENCVNVYAVQVDTHYDSLVLNATSVLEGPFLPSFGGTIVALNKTNVYPDAQPPYGQVYYVASLSGNVSANGSGVLFYVTFTVLSEGYSFLHFIPYPGGGSGVGTYFMGINETHYPPYYEIIPNLCDGYYVIPEFPASLILPLFMIATLPALIVYRRKKLLSSLVFPVRNLFHNYIRTSERIKAH